MAAYCRSRPRNLPPLPVFASSTAVTHICGWPVCAHPVGDAGTASLASRGPVRPLNNNHGRCQRSTSGHCHVNNHTPARPQRLSCRSLKRQLDSSIGIENGSNLSQRWTVRQVQPQRLQKRLLCSKASCRLLDGPSAQTASTSLIPPKHVTRKPLVSSPHTGKAANVNDVDTHSDNVYAPLQDLPP